MIWTKQAECCKKEEPKLTRQERRKKLINPEGRVRLPADRKNNQQTNKQIAYNLTNKTNTQTKTTIEKMRSPGRQGKASCRPSQPKEVARALWGWNPNRRRLGLPMFKWTKYCRMKCFMKTLLWNTKFTCPTPVSPATAVFPWDLPHLECVRVDD